MIVCTFDTVIVFSMLYIISTTIDYAKVMLSIYATLSSHLLAVRKGERAAAHMQGTVLTLARLKTVPTIQELVSLQCQCVNE